MQLNSTLIRKSEGRRLLGEPFVDVMKTLKKKVMKLWTGFSWLRKMFRYGLL
jgi:hypothetical protein